MRTYILIGASNVTLSLPLLWHSFARSTEPLRVFVVAGHGRSYGKPSTVMGRTLPGILQSECWQQMEELIAPDSDVRALVTDVGNDILYGMEPQQIGSWVREALTRLQRFTNRITLTELPLCSMSQLSLARFRFFRTLLFPNSKLQFADALNFGTQLNESLRQLTSEFQVTTVVPQSHWYGFDPIHIRRGQRPAVWRQCLQTLDEDFQVIRPALPKSISTWRLKPALRWNGQTEYRVEQPILRLMQHELWLY